MKCKNIITVAAVSLMLTGCGLYDKYEAPLSSPGGDTNALFGMSILLFKVLSLKRE